VLKTSLVLGFDFTRNLPGICFRIIEPDGNTRDFRI